VPGTVLVIGLKERKKEKKKKNPMVYAGAFVWREGLENKQDKFIILFVEM
jgi:hypothetical protein